MASLLGKYINENPLFQEKYLQNSYRYLSDRDIRNLLDEYRVIALEYANTLSRDGNSLSTLVESFDNFRPNEELLKQSSLYLDSIIISDPVFELTLPKGEIDKTMNAYLGMQTQDINRAHLTRAVTYMNHLRTSIASNFVQFLPVSHLHEPPKQIVTEFSETLFADIAPQDIMEMFWKSAKIYPLDKVESGWRLSIDKQLQPCRAIAVHFEGIERDSIYFLFETKVTEIDKDTGRIVVAQRLPDEPPAIDAFNNWISQSTNQAARRVITSIGRETYLAQQLGCTYLVKSAIVNDLLTKQFTIERNIDSELANMVLDLDLPLLGNIALDDLIKVREKDGEAFLNFRTSLKKKLRDLRHIADQDKLNIELQNTAQEISEVQLREVHKKMNLLRKTSIVNTSLFIGGLFVTIQTSGVGLAAVLYAMEKGYKSYIDYVTNVKENPAFFLWKASKEASRPKRNRKLQAFIKNAGRPSK